MYDNIAFVNTFIIDLLKHAISESVLYCHILVSKNRVSTNSVCTGGRQFTFLEGSLARTLLNHKENTLDDQNGSTSN